MPKITLFFPKTFDDPAWAGSSFCVDAPDGDHAHGRAGEWVIGRHPAADITLAIQSISGRHCSLAYSYAANQWSVIDLGSKNGTRVNGKLLEPGNPHPVAIGDRLHLGPNPVHLVEDEHSTEDATIEPTTIASRVPLDHRTGEPLPPPVDPSHPKTWQDSLHLGVMWLITPTTLLGAVVRLIVVGVAATVIVIIFDGES